MTEAGLPTEALAIPEALHEQPVPENIRAFRAANLKVVALILNGAEPRGQQVIEACRMADVALKGV